MEKHIITMLGEKDHGKSTLIGSMLIATGTATEHRISEAKKYSNLKKGKRFEPGYILDSFEEERQNEMTIDTTRAEMLYKDNLFEFIDVPGHLELIKNMMSGASHGEIAILMVSMKADEGLQPQTKRHVYIANMLGIKALIVAINKMDLVKYDKPAFDKMKHDIAAYLKAIGFNKPVSYVPVSAYDSQNLISSSDKMKWYTGMPLIEELALFTASRKVSSMKSGMRAIVQDVVDHEGKEMMFCLLTNGSIKVGQQIRLEPSGSKAKVLEIYLKGEKTKSAESGSNIAIIVDGKAKVGRGSVVMGADDKPHTTKSLESITFFIKSVSSSSEFEVKINNNTLPAKMTLVKELISPETGAARKGTSKIPSESAARIQLELKSKYPIERSADYNELGRFALYSKGKFCGIGIVV
jgi:bifunctional enzyme CysN/CysC/sulfate adenylyltransferase subunit 1